MTNTEISDERLDDLWVEVAKARGYSVAWALNHSIVARAAMRRALSESLSERKGESDVKVVLNAADRSEAPEGLQLEPDYTAMEPGDLLTALGDDGYKWAVAFCQHYERHKLEVEPGIMLTWFANAIEHSSDVRRARTEALAASSGTKDPNTTLPKESSWRSGSFTRGELVEALERASRAATLTEHGQMVARFLADHLQRIAEGKAALLSTEGKNET